VNTAQKKEHFASIRSAQSMLNAARTELLNLHAQALKYASDQQLDEIRLIRCDLVQLIKDLERLAEFRLEFQRVEAV